MHAAHAVPSSSGFEMSEQTGSFAHALAHGPTHPQKPIRKARASLMPDDAPGWASQHVSHDARVVVYPHAPPEADEPPAADPAELWPPAAEPVSERQSVPAGQPPVPEEVGRRHAEAQQAITAAKERVLVSMPASSAGPRASCVSWQASHRGRRPRSRVGANRAVGREGTTGAQARKSQRPTPSPRFARTPRATLACMGT